MLLGWEMEISQNSYFMVSYLHELKCSVRFPFGVYLFSISLFSVLFMLLQDHKSAPRAFPLLSCFCCLITSLISSLLDALVLAFGKMTLASGLTITSECDGQFIRPLKYYVHLISWSSCLVSLFPVSSLIGFVAVNCPPDSFLVSLYILYLALFCCFSASTSWARLLTNVLLPFLISLPSYLPISLLLFWRFSWMSL